MKYNPLLDPFCNECGMYKGIGFCKNPDCKSQIPESENETDSGVQTRYKQVNQQNLCCLCENLSIVICCRCNQGYCETHSSGLNESRLCHKDQHIGLCIKCQRFVCENCWILNDSGSILCLNHLEEPENSAKE